MLLVAGCAGAPLDRGGEPNGGGSAAPPAAAAGAEASPKRTILERARENVARSEAAWAARSTADLGALYTKDAAIVSWGAEGGRRESTEEMVRGLDGFWRGLAAVKMRTSRVTVAGDVALAEWVVVGSTKAGLPLAVPGASLMWFNDDGLVIREQLYLDEQTTAMQLGDRSARGRSPAAEPPQTVWLTGGEGAEQKASAALVTGFYRAIEKKDPDALRAALAEGAVYRDLARPDDVAGHGPIAEDFARFTAAFPDLRFELGQVLSAGRVVVVEGTWTGTMTGALGSLVPTQKKGSVHFVDVAEIENGKIVRLTSYSNGAELAGAFFSPGG